MPSALTSVPRPGVAPGPVAVGARRSQPVVRALLLSRWRFSYCADNSTPSVLSKNVLLPMSAIFGSYGVGEIAVDALRGAGEIAFGLIEWPARDDAHRAADAAFGHVRRRRLDDFDARDELDRQIAEVHIAAAADRQRQRRDAVDLDAIQDWSAPRMLTLRPSPS